MDVTPFSFDWTVNIPTLIAVGTILVGLLKVHKTYVAMEFKVNELWRAYRYDREVKFYKRREDSL